MGAVMDPVTGTFTCTVVSVMISDCHTSSALGDFILQPPSLHLESEFQVHYPLSLFLNELLLPFKRMR